MKYFIIWRNNVRGTSIAEIIIALILAEYTYYKKMTCKTISCILDEIIEVLFMKIFFA